MKTKMKTKTETKVCINCRKDIETGQEYIKLEEYNTLWELVKTNFIHKSCWLLQMTQKKKIWDIVGRTEMLLNRAETM